MEILTRIYLGLFAALIFGGFPALLCAVVTWKVVRARREGVWVPRTMGRLRRWTVQDHPDKFWTAITFHTILAVGLGLIAAAVMIGMFLACVLTPTNRTTDAKAANPATAPANRPTP